MAPQLKLTYFNIPGRAEISRLALHYGQIPFEDERLQRPEFLAIKPTLPLGQVPVLTVDGQMYSQTNAIARYAAKLAGLYPQDPLEALRVDMFIDTVIESWTALVDFSFYEQDQAKKQEKKQKFVDVTLPHLFNALERMIHGDFVLQQISLADISLFDHIENGIKTNCCVPDFKLDAYPKIHQVYHNVKSHPNLAEYLAKQKTN